MQKTNYKTYQAIEDACDCAEEHYIFTDAIGRQNDIIMNLCSDNYSIDYTQFIDGVEYDGGQLEGVTKPQLLVDLLIENEFIRRAK
tara:strand:+ start:624 stop:881 length:258 start_codon:yes stop_codon:yes gene_type:complete